MINQKEADILKYLLKRSPSNNSIVIEFDEIISNVSEKLEKDELLQLLTDLSGREAISNYKVVDMQECVLTPTPKAKVLLDELSELEEAKKIINTVSVKKKTAEAEQPTPAVTDNRKKYGWKRSSEPIEQKPIVQNVVTKVVINYKKLFWTAFCGAFCGGGIIGLIMLIINAIG